MRISPYRLGGASIATALTVFAALPAHATAVTGSFTGIMNQGSSDTHGHLGTAGVDYSGQAISGTFTYDTTAFSGDSCTGVSGEGCFHGPVTITENITGANSVTFVGDAPGGVSGLNLYANFPQSSSGTDEFTLASVDSTNGFTSGTTLDVWSTTDNFITDALNAAVNFNISSLQLTAGAGGNISFETSISDGESLGFQFTNVQASTSAGGTQPAPEPSSLAAFGAGLVALALATRRRRVRFG